MYADRWLGHRLNGKAARACLSDGLHPNGKGGAFIGAAVLAAIAQHYPELRPSAFGDADESKLPYEAPDHKSIELDDIDGSVARHEADWERRARRL